MSKPLRKKLLSVAPVLGFVLIGVFLFAFAKMPKDARQQHSLNDPQKTLEYFIFQNNTVLNPPSGTSSNSYDVFIGELDSTNTKNVALKNAYVDISGSAISSGAFSMTAQVNSQSLITYNFPSTGGDPLAFNVVYNVTSLNFDFPGSTTPSNTLSISFPSAPTSVSLLGAKQIVTYEHD